MTSRALAVTLGLILLILILVGGVWYFFLRTVPVPVGSGAPSGQNPFGEPASGIPIGTPGQNASSTDTISIETRNGSMVTAPDFTTGKSSFLVGTHQFYFLTNNVQTEGANAQFDIIYGTDSSITISLLKEPLGEARAAAEAELRQLISLSDAQLCSLNVSVGVPYGVNQYYAGQQLGLSFCPGATELPN